MKKLIISLISGAILIGVGIGVLMMEIAEFSISDTYPDVKNSPLQEFSITDENFFEAAGKNAKFCIDCKKQRKRDWQASLFLL